MSDLIGCIGRIPLNAYAGFIEKIRFPFYKKMKPGTQIQFEFPLTVFVGPNGCGKTSVLQALYGCPDRKSLSDFWFSTIVDPIAGTGAKANRYIYQYTPKGLGHSVEIVKARRHRVGKPEYWETDKPLIGDGMAAMPEQFTRRSKAHRSKTRWKAVKKDVLYIDFKAELSAFDKFFNFGSYIPRKNIRTKQDFLRFRSKPLKEAIVSGRDDVHFHTRRVTSNKLLDDEELSWVSKILGKDYIEARVISHDFFGSGGLSILFQENVGAYSEAVAGSGEVAVVSCVMQVLAALPGTLILIDEPEVSLHPGAQQELRNFLLSQIKDNKHQVVLTTHSPILVDGLPSKAIKVFHRVDNGHYDVIDGASAEQAFVRLGHISYRSNKVIYVEDDLSQLLVSKAIKQIDEALSSSVLVKVYPGGGPQIKQDLLVHMLVSGNDGISVLLDGDQRKVDECASSMSISPERYSNLENIVKENIGRKISLPLNGGNADNSQQKIDMQLRILDIYRERFFFGNTWIPEELVWQSAKNQVGVSEADFEDIPCYKNKFKEYTAVDLGIDLSELRASDLLQTQRRFASKIPENDELWNGFLRVVRGIVFSE
jgi:energy-coupling factor transporter ATP-binding protein EcfA2